MSAHWRCCFLRNGWRKIFVKKTEPEIVPLLRMFVRKKNNKSGTVSVVIVSKQSGAYREIHRVGTSSKEPELAKLVEEGKDWIRRQNTIPDMFDQYDREKFERDSVEYFFNRIENILLNGTQLILNRVFSLTGFDKLNDAILKDLVIARICQPSSKSATVDYTI